MKTSVAVALFASLVASGALAADTTSTSTSTSTTSTTSTSTTSASTTSTSTSTTSTSTTSASTSTSTAGAPKPTNQGFLICSAQKHGHEGKGKREYHHQPARECLTNKGGKLSTFTPSGHPDKDALFGYAKGSNTHGAFLTSAGQNGGYLEVAANTGELRTDGRADTTRPLLASLSDSEHHHLKITIAENQGSFLNPGTSGDGTAILAKDSHEWVIVITPKHHGGPNHGGYRERPKDGDGDEGHDGGPDHDGDGPDHDGDGPDHEGDGPDHDDNDDDGDDKGNKYHPPHNRRLLSRIVGNSAIELD